MSYKVSTQLYSGPFDLLLKLVSQQKVDIGALSISEITSQYLLELERMQEMDLEVASDFIVVASTLLDLKASILLPKDTARAVAEENEYDELDALSADDAREVLIARLIAYKQFRNAAAALASRYDLQSRLIPRFVGPDPAFMNCVPDYLDGITLHSLAVICADLDSKRKTFLLEAQHIAAKKIPLAQTIVSVDRFIANKKKCTFKELLLGQSSNEVVVVTFLALLELFKQGSVHISQEELFGEINVSHVEGAAPISVPMLDSEDEL